VGLWRYAPLIPVDESGAVSTGEGGTPVVALKKLGSALGLDRLYAKLEYFSPTGSFKDRGTTVLATRAKELGVTRLVEDSSGNAGASFAAYCARAGIAASIYVPASAPEAKKAQIAFYGAEVVAVPGTREDVTEAAIRRCREDGAYYGSHNLNPWFLQGTKTFAYEVAEEFGFNPPEHVVMPVGNGSLFLGAEIGFGELLELGVIDRSPGLHVAQAEACMPIVDAYRRGLEQTEEIHTRPTVAGGISIARPSRGRMILRAMRESGGSGAAVGDAEILRFQRLLASLEGLFCEPTSAAAFAALPELVRQEAIDPAERVLVAVTGIGLKDLGVLTR
jgi:threonine synthase